jgi:hypothetical protein
MTLVMVLYKPQLLLLEVDDNSVQYQEIAADFLLDW